MKRSLRSGIIARTLVVATVFTFAACKPHHEKTIREIQDADAPKTAKLTESIIPKTVKLVESTMWALQVGETLKGVALHVGDRMPADLLEPEAQKKSPNLIMFYIEPSNKNISTLCVLPDINVDAIKALMKLDSAKNLWLVNSKRIRIHIRKMGTTEYITYGSSIYDKPLDMVCGLGTPVLALISSDGKVKALGHMIYSVDAWNSGTFSLNPYFAIALQSID
ncbi:MAG: hypothetical protein Q7S22_03260 [Candidatus Micrarchaeota archaeon]|nr:hypothetical protein [Candidatus Micrarchaeota archaeon]